MKSKKILQKIKLYLEKIPKIILFIRKFEQYLASIPIMGFIAFHLGKLLVKAYNRGWIPQTLCPLVKVAIYALFFVEFFLEACIGAVVLTLVIFRLFF